MQSELMECVATFGEQSPWLTRSTHVVQVGVQGDLWVVGAQNAGKSSLINALRWEAGTAEVSAPLTTAALPGTTLDMVPVDGLPLQSRSRCYDTPGVPHPYQYTSRLSGALICCSPGPCPSLRHASPCWHCVPGCPSYPFVVRLCVPGCLACECEQHRSRQHCQAHGAKLSPCRC